MGLILSRNAGRVYRPPASRVLLERGRFEQANNVYPNSPGNICALEVAKC